MADPQAELKAALAEAVQESGYDTGDDDATKSWDEWDKDGSPAEPEEAPSKGDPEEDDSTPEPADEAVEQEEELPDEYWGVSLDGIPNDAKKAILDHFAQQDSTIQKLQARLATEPEAPTAPEPELESDEITDEALAAALGYDPEDSYNQPTKAELAMARTVIALEDQVERLVTKDQVSEVQTQWNRQLDELEEVQGKLPFSREQVLRYAIEEQIASPYEVYFRLLAPGKREVEQTVAKARREAAKRAEGGGVKPRSASGTAPEIDPKTTSLRDAVAIAMKETEKETGLSFRNLFGRKVPQE